MADQREADEIEEQTATVLPNREAMSVIDPSFITRVVPGVDQSAQPTTDQGIDESDPSGSA